MTVAPAARPDRPSSHSRRLVAPARSGWGNRTRPERSPGLSGDLSYGTGVILHEDMHLEIEERFRGKPEDGAVKGTGGGSLHNDSERSLAGEGHGVDKSGCQCPTEVVPASPQAVRADRRSRPEAAGWRGKGRGISS